MTKVYDYLTPLARFMLALIFLMSGLNKITGYAGSVGYMESVGVPGILLPFAIIVEIAGALMVILGYRARLGALGLAGFSLITAFLFHNNFADQIQSILFMKNIAMAGGLLFIVANGSGAYSLDNRAR